MGRTLLQGQKQEARQYLKRLLQMGSGIGILTAAAILLGRTWLPQLFSQDPYVIAAASRALPIVAFSMVCPPLSHDSSLHDVYKSASFSTPSHPVTARCVQAACGAVVWDAECHTDPTQTLRAILSPQQCSSGLQRSDVNVDSQATSHNC